GPALGRVRQACSRGSYAVKVDRALERCCLSATKKGAHHFRHGLRMFEVWQVAGVVNEFDPCVGDSSSKLLSINRRDEAVGRPPDDERRRRNPVSVLAESAVGDRPDEFTRTGLRPDELRERIDARSRIARNTEEAARGLSVAVGKERGPSHLVAEDHPVL